MCNENQEPSEGYQEPREAYQGSHHEFQGFTGPEFKPRGADLGTHEPEIEDSHHDFDMEYGGHDGGSEPQGYDGADVNFTNSGTELVSTCSRCKATFPSRNKMFRDLRETRCSGTFAINAGRTS